MVAPSLPPLLASLQTHEGSHWGLQATGLSKGAYLAEGAAAVPRQTDEHWTDETAATRVTLHRTCTTYIHT